MNIQIEIVKENNAGSADAMVHFDKEALELLVEEGVISILRQHIENKQKVKNEKMCDTTLGREKRFSVCLEDEKRKTIGAKNKTKKWEKTESRILISQHTK